MSTTDQLTPAPARGPGPRRLSEIGSLVARRATLLQESRTRSGTVAMLAHLRANVGRDPGADPRVWSLTVDGVPGSPTEDEATPEERAVHAALTLFAVHQQSRPTGVHQAGVGLGRAVARLERAHGGRTDDRTTPERRRFDAVVTADGIDEVVRHLRGLVSQMRSEGIGLDYGMLADDLTEFQRTGGADAVRRRWARQLYSLDLDVTADTEAAPTVSTNPTTEEQQ